MNQASSPASLEPEVAYCPPPDQGVHLWFADEVMLVADKPAGLLTVPGRGPDRQDCLWTRVVRSHPDARIVHRLDMATSGLVVMARDAESHRRLSVAFEQRLVHKRYEAWVRGSMAHDEGEIDLPLVTDWPRRPRQMVCHDHGKPSLTRYRVIERDLERGWTRVSLEPVTGRSHQLRVHLLALGHPIVGDPLYGPVEADSPWGRMCLHAVWMDVPHPGSEEGRRVVLNSPAPF